MTGLTQTSRNHYILFGIALIAGGVALAVGAWFILAYRPLTALGISSVILGTVSLALGRSLPRISPATGLMLLEAGSDNVAALIEELGLRAKGIYLPTYLTDGRPRALVPLHSNSQRPNFEGPLERRLIVKYGPGPEDFGVLVATPGSPALGLIQHPDEGSSADLEAPLSSIFVGALDAAASVSVSREGQHVVVDLAKADMPARPHPVHEVLGSPLASVAAAVVAEVLGCPTRVIEESVEGRTHSIKLEVYAEDVA